MICPNCGAWTDGKQCEYCRTQLDAETGGEGSHHETGEESAKQAVVISSECFQKTKVDSPVDSLSGQTFGYIMLLIPFGVFYFICYQWDCNRFWELIKGIAYGVSGVFALVFLSLLWNVHCAKKAKKFGAERVWNFYRIAPADAARRFDRKWLNTTLIFTGFLNDPIDGKLVAGYASFQDGGSEFQLYFWQKDGKEHLIPGQSICVVGKCEGMKEKTLKLTDCFVLAAEQAEASMP